jgi:hypothetical protein
MEIDLENNNNSKSVSLNRRLCLCLFKRSKTLLTNYLSIWLAAYPWSIGTKCPALLTVLS